MNVDNDTQFVYLMGIWVNTPLVLLFGWHHSNWVYAVV